MRVFMNGKMIAKEDAVISAFDHGFLYGVGLFETFRIYDHHPFLLDDHLERLIYSLEIVNIKWSYTKQDILEALKMVLEENQLANAYIRLNVSAGNGEIGLQIEPYLKPNVIIFAKPLPPVGGMTEKNAVVLNLQRNTPEGLNRLKSHHYLNNLLAKRELGNGIDQEGLFLTKEGYIAEGIVSNIFWITNGVLFTPTIETGILNGVTRQFIIKLVQSLGLVVKEGFYTLNDVVIADEVFFTNSIQEIVPVVHLAGKSFPGKDGKWVKLLHHNYREFCQTLWSRKEL